MMSGKAHRDADVLIVGMGPVGVTLAGLLGQNGISTVVFDKLTDLYPLPRAAGMDHEVMRIAQELGVAARLEPYVVPYRSSQYRGVHGQVIKRLDSPPPPHRLGWDPMMAFDQPAFEGVLRERVGELPAVSVRLDTEVTAVGQDDVGVWANLRASGSSATERISASYLVACDGGASPIRRQLGITMTDLGFHESWLVVDAIIEDDTAHDRLPDTQVQYCEPRRPATFINLVGRHRRWEIALEPGELPVGPVSNDAVWPWLERWIKPGEARIWRAAAYMFHGLVADQWRQGRILLAGDATHMTPPFMAQGMAQGMRDVHNLAWKLHAVLEGRATDQLLDTYEAERRPHVIKATQHTINLGRIISERDERVALARDHELLGDHPEEVPVTYRSNFLPALNAGLIATESPGAGEILPQPFVLATGDPGGPDAVRLDDVVGSGFRVIVTSAVSERDSARLQEAIAPLGGRTVRIHPPGSSDSGTGGTGLVERDGVLTAWLAGLPAAIAIARPDHYVYASAESIDRALAHLADLRAAAGSTPAVAATAIR
jgi:3-(3-hydroxy-phenyl)propionate hydroxylase